MLSIRSFFIPAARWIPRLALVGAAHSFTGCGQSDAPINAPVATPPASANGAGVKDLASAPAPVSPPVPEKERTWDSCSPQDPNPWPWRSDAEGMWGEKDAAIVPSFALRQERRAPKMPDAERYLKTLGSTAATSPLTDALLICLVETYSHHGSEPTLYRYKLQESPARKSCAADWDTLNGPDVLLRFRFRDEYPIALFGPEDHWGFYVSIPSVALAVGDALTVKLWDRDSGTYWNGYVNDQKNEYMGAATMKFDGKLPFTLHSEYFTLRCNAMRSAQTHAVAKGWLAQLDRPIKAAEDFRLDQNRWNFGESEAADSVRGDFGHGIFRYPAGFLGWESPEIQARLKVIYALGARDASRRRALATELMKNAPPVPTGAFTPSGGRGSLRFESTECGKSNCEVHARVDARVLKDLCTRSAPGPRLRASGIDESGKFTSAFTEIENDGAWQACDEETVAAKDGPTRVHIRLLGAPQLLWLGGVAKAAVFKLPMP